MEELQAAGKAFNENAGMSGQHANLELIPPSALIYQQCNI